MRKYDVREDGTKILTECSQVSATEAVVVHVGRRVGRAARHELIEEAVLAIVVRGMVRSTAIAAATRTEYGKKGSEI